MKVVCLLSGGIDSSVMFSKMVTSGNRTVPLFVNYGQISHDQELKAATSICNSLDIKLETIDVSGLSSIPTGLTDPSYTSIHKPDFPARNMILLSVATSLAISRSIRIIAIGVQKCSGFPDQTRTFLDHAERALASATGMKLQILSPLSDLNKLEIVNLAREEGILLSATYSCYMGFKKPCGKCLSCIDRQNALSHSA